MNLQEIAIIIGLLLTGGGLIVTGVGLLFAGKQLKASTDQLKLSQKIATGDFLLRLDDAFRHHYDVHKRLRPHGDWTEPGNGPVDYPNDEWVAVESYMGLFERVKALIDAGIIDLDTVARFYRYRVVNIVRNKKIYEGKKLMEAEEWKKLTQSQRELHGWFDFIELWHTLSAWDRARIEKLNRPTKAS